MGPNTEYESEWNEISTSLTKMPLHIKPSDQANIKGNPIFDPVGSNQYIKNTLVKLGWHSNILIPVEYRFLGKDVDFGKSGILLESQFSNYPFLLNNLLRSELFFKSSIHFAGNSTKLLVIITKAQMFPASNSTLYYEQAVQQLTALIKHHVFDIPIRLIGLFEQKNTTISAIYTVYQSTRYSRIVNTQIDCQCQILSSNARSKRYKIHIP
ncbi:restriction endonuclease [Aulosira sp. FACHB-615]|nr:restriction endonuclease [Nostoc sp. FACHB-190]MBD2489146.1 restriction endonuclease [Aulosira sp. FACHB-615]